MSKESQHKQNTAVMQKHAVVIDAREQVALLRHSAAEWAGSHGPMGVPPSTQIRVWPIRILKIGGVSEGRRFVGVRSFPVLLFHIHIIPSTLRYAGSILFDTSTFRPSAV